MFLKFKPLFSIKCAPFKPKYGGHIYVTNNARVEISGFKNYYTYYCIWFKHVFDFIVMSVLKVFHLYMMENMDKFYEGENVN